MSDDGEPHSSCLADVINDPSLLESFLSNGGSNSTTTIDTAGNTIESESTTVTPTAAAKTAIESSKLSAVNRQEQQQPHKLKESVTQGSLEAARQVDMVTSSDGISAVETKTATVDVTTSLVNPSTISSITTNSSLTTNVSGPSSVTISLPSLAGQTFPLSVANTPTTVTVQTSQPQQIPQTITLRPQQINAANAATIHNWTPQTIQVPTSSVRTSVATTGITYTGFPHQQMVQMSGTGLTSGLGPVLLTRPGGINTGGLSTSTGQLNVQIITPTGAQFVPMTPTSVSTVVQGAVSPVVSKSTTSASSARSTNKQILPKPSQPSLVTASSLPSSSASSQSPSLVRPTYCTSSIGVTQSTNHPSVGHHQTNAPAQFILSGAPTGPQLIAGPNGTFLLSNPSAIQGLTGTQPQFVLQGNGLGNLGQLQLTLKPSGPTLANTTGPIIQTIGPAGATNSSIPRTSIIQNQPTFVLPPNTAAAPNVAMPGTGNRATGPGIVLTRTPTPVIQAANQQQAPTMFQSSPQIIQIQTPNGPMLVALNAAPPPQPNTVITGPTVSQSFTISGTGGTNGPFNTNGTGLTFVTTNPSNTHTSELFSGPLSSSSNIAGSHQIHGNKEKAKSKSVKGVNLGDLLKESGILDSSPPSSPPGQTKQTSINHQPTPHDSTTAQSELVVQPSNPATTAQPALFVMPSVPNAGGNILLAPSPATLAQSNTTPQLRLALTPEGNVVLQPAQPTIGSFITTVPPTSEIDSGQLVNSAHVDKCKDQGGLGSSQPSPDSTTPTIDATPTTLPSKVDSQFVDKNISEETQNDTCKASISTALANESSKQITKGDHQPQLIGQGEADKCANNVILTTTSTSTESTINTCPSDASTAVIRIGNCDSIVQSSALPVLLPTNDQMTLRPNVTTAATTSAVTNTTVVTTGLAPELKIQQQPLQQPQLQQQQIQVQPQQIQIQTQLQPQLQSLATNVTAPTHQASNLNGVPVVQISSDDHEFIERLENQLKLLSSLPAPSDQQKQLLHELQSLRKNLDDSAKQIQQSKQAKQTAIQTPNLTPTAQASNEPMKVLIVPPRIQIQGQNADHPNAPTIVLQSTAPGNAQNQTGHQPVHLVNLLKPANATQPTVRLITPVSVSSNDSTGQVLPRFIITSPAKPTLQTIIPAGSIVQTQIPGANSTLIQVTRFQSPVTTPSVQSSSSISSTSSKIIPETDPEKRKARITKFFQQQLSADQAAAVKPDTKSPFKSRDDACKRLLRFHVFDKPTPSAETLDKIDQDFELIAYNLLVKQNQLYDRFRRCLLRQDLKFATEETVMLHQLFVDDETTAIKFDKEVVAQGRPLDLPPPPQSWKQDLNFNSSSCAPSSFYMSEPRDSSISLSSGNICQNPYSDPLETSAMSEYLNKKKRPLDSSGDLNSGTIAVKKLASENCLSPHGLAIQPHKGHHSHSHQQGTDALHLHSQDENNSDSEETEEEDEDSDDDDDDEDDDDDDDDGNPADDMSKYLGPNDNGHLDINSIYDDIAYDQVASAGASSQNSNQTTSASLSLNSFRSHAPGVSPSASLHHELFVPLHESATSASTSNSTWGQTYPSHPSHHRGDGSSSSNLPTHGSNNWPGRFCDSEAAVAVGAILTSEEEGDEGSRLSADLSAIAVGRGETSQDEDEDEDDEEEDDDQVTGGRVHDVYHSYGDHASTSTTTMSAMSEPVTCDPQIQCAIDSILVDQNSYYHASHANVNDSYGRSANAATAAFGSHGSDGGMSTLSSRPMAPSYGQMNDEALDEAVKSILS